MDQQEKKLKTNNVKNLFKVTKNSNNNERNIVIIIITCKNA